MNNNVTTLETSQRLQAAGFPQGSTYFVISADLLNEGVVLPRIYAQTTGIENYIAAPTAQEIADQLPHRDPNNRGLLTITIDSEDENKVCAGRGSNLASMVRADNLAEALANLYLALKLQEAK